MRAKEHIEVNITTTVQLQPRHTKVGEATPSAARLAGCNGLLALRGKVWVNWGAFSTAGAVAEYRSDS